MSAASNKSRPDLFARVIRLVECVPHPDFFLLAGSVAVPVAQQDAAWDDIVRTSHNDRAITRLRASDVG